MLHGEGGVFCAGADLKAVGTPTGNRVAADGDGPMGPTRMRLSKPVIAAIAGHAVAGGLELALWCDLRVAEEDAVFGVFCRRWGVPLIDGGTVRLPRLIGVSRAMDMILTGRPVGAGEALQMGLVNRVVADGQSRAAAEELAQELARFPQRCMREDRLSLLEQERSTSGRRSRTSSSTGSARWPRCRRGSSGSAPAPGGTAHSIDWPRTGERWLDQHGRAGPAVDRIAIDDRRDPLRELLLAPPESGWLQDTRDDRPDLDEVLDLQPPRSQRRGPDAQAARELWRARIERNRGAVDHDPNRREAIFRLLAV